MLVICRGLSVNDVLDELERSNFFNSDIYISATEKW